MHTLAHLRHALRRRRRPEAVIDRAYPMWLRTHRTASVDDVVPIRISVVMPVHDPREDVLRDAIASVRAQQHAAWELCMADDGSAAPHVRRILAAAAAEDTRIKYITLNRSAGIAAASNAALRLASGEFVALLDHDDTLAPHALARVAAEIGRTPDLDMLFSDEDQLDGDGRRVSPYFKPGWNPDLLLGQNTACHLAVYRRSLVDDLGGFREGFEGSQDFDLALRVSSATLPRRIRHIPDVLYHWRQSPESCSAARAAACQDSARRALAEHLQGHATVAPNAVAPQWSDARFDVPQRQPLVSIISAGAQPAPRDPLYTNVEYLAGYHWRNVEAARGAVLVFAGGLASASPGWVRFLVANALRPGVGCAGARIDDANGRIADAGYVLDAKTIVQSLAPGSDAEDPGYRGHFCLMRTVSAVSLACMAVRRDVFLDAGGLEPRAGAYASVDLALRLAGKNLRCVWVPLARAQARVGRSLPDDAAGAAYMRERWAAELAHDRYFNPNLVIRDGQLGLRPVVSDRQLA